MHRECQQVIEKLGINIELLFQRLDTRSNKLLELDKEIICQSLLGQSRKDIANIFNLCSQAIGDRLSDNIYPGIAELMQVDQKQIAGNWVRIINFLLNPTNDYKLNPAPQLNNDNFQGSFGRQIFLYPPNQEIVRSQVEGTQFYQQGLYYKALNCFLLAWKQELQIYKTGNPEVLIYINNCLIEYKKSFLEERKIKIHTLAVVVPFYHNQGQVAAEILRGIAQIQLQTNLQSFGIDCLKKEKYLDAIIPNSFYPLKNRSSRVALRILIVNDPNNLYAPDNQTAENLVNLAPQLNLIAILGHYSSEMTQKALHLYSKSKNGLLLVNSSSTSNELSHLSRGENLSFFRLTTQDSINAEKLAHYLTERFSAKCQKRVAIIYNKNSSYSISYKNSIETCIKQHNRDFTFLEECDYLSENYNKIYKYLEYIRQEGVDIIIIIPDGGIEPNSLNNTGLISRLNLQNCLIAGSATFYQENVLHWIYEQSQYNSTNQDGCQIIACIPWHWHSQENGCNSSNFIAQAFCQMGTQLWGEENLTWRSATAFDSVLIILEALELHYKQDSESLLNGQSLLEQMDRYFKKQNRELLGVTGNIRFEQNGDRINPPAEIVAVKWNAQQQKWKWTNLSSM